MALRTLSVPQVIINDEVINIVPNSFKFSGGMAEVTVRAASAGNGQVESVHSENVENAFSKCSFDVFPISDYETKSGTWKQNIGSNVIKAAQQDAGGTPFTRTFPGMSLVNDPEWNASADGVVSLEFAGDQMIRG